jgi:radical SAM-linked protein
MQRIACRYRREEEVAMLGAGEVRALLLNAVQDIGPGVLPVQVIMGPPLPRGATSEAERCVFDLSNTVDPVTMAEGMNARVPAGLYIEMMWVVTTRHPDEAPLRFTEAEYAVSWREAPPADEIGAKLRALLAAVKAPLTREREKRTQVLDARPLLKNVTVSDWRNGEAHLRIVVSVGPDGALRPEEVLQLAGWTPEPGSLKVRRVALRQPGSQCSAALPGNRPWRRQKGQAGPCQGA